MPTFVDDVSFDTIAREWRCKWSEDNDKKSLSEANKAIMSVLDEMKKIDGVKGVQRAICSSCHDFKVIIALHHDKFGPWAEGKFAPEEAVLAKLKEIDGISTIETQSYALTPM